MQPTIDEAWLHARWSGDAAAARADLHRLRLALAELDLALAGTAVLMELEGLGGQAACGPVHSVFQV